MELFIKNMITPKKKTNAVSSQSPKKHEMFPELGLGMLGHLPFEGLEHKDRKNLNITESNHVKVWTKTYRNHT